MYDKIRKLETDIANEKAMRADRELEILEKDKTIGQKGKGVNSHSPLHKCKRMLTNLCMSSFHVKLTLDVL